MRDALPIMLPLIVAPFLVGCQSNATQNPRDGSADAVIRIDNADPPVAYLNGQAVNRSEIYRLIVPAHGGDALAEILIDRAVKGRLDQQAIRLTPEEIEAERNILLASLDTDPDRAARLMREMRSQRGLDEKRFGGMLERNAGLRRLVRDEVKINDLAIQEAYKLRYGQRYEVRLITSENLDALNQARREVISGASFTDLAIDLSTDISASQGGLLSPISPADPTYPKAIRDALWGLKMDGPEARLSPAIALNQGYALLWLEQVVQPEDPPEMASVRGELERSVRRELERLRMRQLARTLIEQADIVVLDPALNQAWQRQGDAIRNP
ncbi:MAG: hypothetical protein AAF711_04145 [Planctomycetota bacterium]